MTRTEIIIEDPNIVPMDSALWQAAQTLELRFIITGGSGYGWSRYSTLQKCPYKYNLKYRKKVERGAAPAPLEIGACFHAFMAMYYQRINDLTIGHEQPTPEAGELCDLLLEYNADALRVNEAWRIFEAYAAHYENNGDYLHPLAVEVHAADRKSPSTCRYDLIAEVHETRPGILPGIYIVEHKSASRLDRGNQEGWHLDGEIMGQLMLWGPSGMKAKYGPLQGVIVNIVTKTKWPNFHREIVSPPTKHIRRQKKDLKMWRGLETLYDSTNTWPRSLASCWGRYGACEFFDHCRDG